MTIQEIKKKNKEAGRYFFSPATMECFGSRVFPDVYKKCLFITSEKDFRGENTLFTVRCAMPNGRIETVGEFQQFKTLEAAIEFAEAMPENIDKIIEAFKTLEAAIEYAMAMPENINKTI